jgi:RHS repeat-associated protein
MNFKEDMLMESRASLFPKLLLISFLVFLMFFSCPVHAEDLPTGTGSTILPAAASDRAAETVPDNPGSADSRPADPALPPDKKGQAPPDSTASASADGSEVRSFTNLPTVTNSSFTGSAVTTIPIEVPPGRGGITPNLTLAYRNMQKNGWLGVGWDLDMGAIQRATKFGVTYPATLPGTDFVAMVNGAASELVSRGDWGANYFGAKIEGQFSKYYYNPVTGGWEVTAKTGTKYYYGSTSASRQDSGSQVFKWCLDKVQDKNGNYMTVSYFKENGEIYLDRIDYTGNANSTPLSPTNYVKFYRDDGSRPDASDMYVPNFRVKTLYRLKTIEVRGNGSLARAYSLNYANNGTTTTRSVLTTVRQYGSDAVISNGTITSGTSLLIFNGSYDTGGKGLVTPDFTQPPLPGTITGGYTTSHSNGTYMLNGDFNGDGRTDYMWVPSNGDGRWLIAYGTSTGFTTPDYNTPALPATITGGYATNHSNGSYMKTGDFNGDGKTDYMWIPYNIGDGRWLIAYGTSTGFTTPNYSTPALPATITGGYSTRHSSSAYMLAGDFNGDGKTDYMWIPYNIGDGRWLIAYGTSTGFTTPDYNSPALPATITGGYSTRHSSSAYMLTGDFNGDGKTDYMWIPYNIGDGRWLIAYGAGTGFTTPDYNSPALPATITGGYSTRHSSSAYMLTGDFNGDGKTDYMWIPYNIGDGRWLIAYGAGTGFTTPDYSTPALPAFTGGYATNNSSGAYMKTGDFNGDGKTDYMWIPNNGNGRWLIAYASGKVSISGPDFTIPDPTTSPALPGLLLGYWPTSNSNAAFMRTGDFNGDGKTDYMWSLYDGRWLVAYANAADHLPEVLTSATNAIGGSSAITYIPSTRFTNTQLPFPIQLVNSITTNDGNGNSSLTYYYYCGGIYDFQKRDFRGFSWVRQYNPDGTSVLSFFNQDSIFKGLMLSQEMSDSAGNRYTTAFNTYQQTSPYTGCNFPFLAQTDSNLFDGTSSCKQIRVLFEYDNTNGNLKRKYNYGDISVSGDEKDEYYEYVNDSSHTSLWIVSLPSHTYIKDGSGTKMAENWYDYYSGTVNLHTKTDWLNGGTNPVTSFGYNAYGNLTSTTDPKGNVTTATFDATYTYPALTTNPLSFTVSKTYDYRYGKPLTETDFNSNTTTYQYDVFGRLTKAVNPYDTSSTYGTQSVSYDNFGSLGTQKITTRLTEQSGTGNYLWQESYFDGFGRTIKTRSEGPDGKVIVTTSQYNNMGRLTKSSLPYFEGFDAAQLVTYAYDPMGRLKMVTNPAGKSTTKSYTLGKTVIIDANGHKKEEDRDAYGRLTQVREYTGVNPSFTLYATTNYQYNTLDKLVKVTDTSSNITTINYDTLGRKKSMTDPDMGYWQYFYDTNGNLTTQLDAKNQSVTFTYDALNRVKLKHYPTGTDGVYTYDESFTPNYKGRLTTVTDAAGTTKFYYDKLGRVTKTIKTIDGVNYQTETTYDAMGRTTSFKYPDAETVNYTYNTGGNLWQAGSYATCTAYNAAGQMGTVTYGNNVVSNYAYNPATMRLKSMQMRISGVLQQSLINLYDDGGIIKSITDNLDDSRTQNFLYDELNRLKQAQSTAYGTISYQYDPIGNMSSNSQVGTYTYPTNHIRPHAVSQAGTKSYGYDANGNMISKNGTTIAYDYDNRPASIGATTFVYDYAGQRVKKNGTVYIGNICEYTGGVCTKYIFAGGRRIAMKSGATVNYYHTDHLGSSSIVTNAAGAKVEEVYYYPYGATRSNTGSVNVKHKYTGQEEDAETGLYYYGARYYDPTIGRFISADTIVQAPGAPQTLNRFAYVGNNPVIYTDPSGHSFWSNLFNALDPITYLSRKATEHIYNNISNDNIRSILLGMDRGFWGSISPQIAAEEGGLAGVAGWITGGTLSYSYEGGWGAHAGGGYACFFGSTDWQSRGPNGGFTETVGIGYRKGYFIAGLALSYNFSHDQNIQANIFAGAQGSGFSLGGSYNFNNGYASGWSNISIGSMLAHEIPTSEIEGGRPMAIVNWIPGMQNVTGIEGSDGWFGENHWATKALDVVALHPIAVLHDNWVTGRWGMGPEFISVMFPSAFAGRSIAGPYKMNPYGF